MTKTKIVVNPPQNKPLTFYVDDYELVGGLIYFIDPRNPAERKGFPTSWCEVTEVA